MHQIMGGKLARSFVAEYHLLLQESGLGDTSWATLVEPTEESFAEANAANRQLDHQTWLENRQMPALSADKWLDDRLRKGLNRDISYAASMGLPAMIDELHMPILQWRADRGDADSQFEPIPGAAALHLWAPNFTKLEWKHILELHDHDAIGEFRQKLVEAEQTVTGVPKNERAVALKDIGYQAALEALRDRSAGWIDLGIDMAIGSVVDLIPYGGLLHSAVTGGAKVRKEEREWTTILLKLNPAS
jgi:hypothetical protein